MNERRTEVESEQVNAGETETHRGVPTSPASTWNIGRAKKRNGRNAAFIKLSADVFLFCFLDFIHRHGARPHFPLFDPPLSTHSFASGLATPRAKYWPDTLFIIDAFFFPPFSSLSLFWLHLRTSPNFRAKSFPSECQRHRGASVCFHAAVSNFAFVQII